MEYGLLVFVTACQRAGDGYVQRSYRHQQAGVLHSQLNTVIQHLGKLFSLLQHKEVETNWKYI